MPVTTSPAQRALVRAVGSISESLLFEFQHALPEPTKARARIKSQVAPVTDVMLQGIAVSQRVQPATPRDLQRLPAHVLNQSFCKCTAGVCVQFVLPAIIGQDRPVSVS